MWKSLSSPQFIHNGYVNKFLGCVERLSGIVLLWIENVGNVDNFIFKASFEFLELYLLGKYLFLFVGLFC